MSDAYYTCDYCVENGHDEVACHRDYELSVYGDKVVCDGCRECGEFPEFDDDDVVLLEFIPPDKERIALLEAVAEALVQQYYSNPYVTMHMAVYEALRAAGYLKEDKP